MKHWKKYLLWIFIAYLDCVAWAYLVLEHETAWNTVSHQVRLVIYTCAFVTLLLVQLYFLGFSKRKKETKQLFWVGAGFIFFTIAVVQAFLLRAYLFENGYTRHPIIDPFAKQLEGQPFQLDKKYSKMASNLEDGLYFYFEPSEENLVSSEVLKTLLTFLPDDMPSDFLFSFSLNQKWVTLYFNPQKEMVHCLDEKNETYEACSLYFTHALSSLEKELRNDFAMKAVLRKGNRFELIEFMQTEEAVTLRIENDGNAIQEKDVEELYALIKPHTQNQRVTIQIANKTSSKKKEPFLTFTFTYDVKKEKENIIEYTACQVKFCHNIHLFYPEKTKFDTRHVSKKNT